MDESVGGVDGNLQRVSRVRNCKVKVPLGMTTESHWLQSCQIHLIVFELIVFENVRLHVLPTLTIWFVTPNKDLVAVDNGKCKICHYGV
jgi:hypothetical protein